MQREEVLAVQRDGVGCGVFAKLLQAAIDFRRTPRIGLPAGDFA